MNKTEVFIDKAKKIHGDKYDYSLVEYFNNRIKIKIKCCIHGMFEQIPNCHLNGSGCRKCSSNTIAQKQRKTADQFIEDANKIHNNIYDYGLVEYQTSKTNVKIKCKIHGIFEQTPNMHLRGQGCPKCGIDKCTSSHLKTTQEFIDDAIRVHGEIYDYSLVDYKKSSIKIKIICNTHGVFEQLPSGHLNGYGCTKCGYELATTKLRSNKNEFINKAIKIHGNKYDYFFVIYKTNDVKVKIFCLDHGIFEQKPNGHLIGHGCPYCVNSI